MQARLVSGVALVLTLAVVHGVEPAPGPKARTEPIPVAEAAQLFRLHPGLRIELVVSDPLIESPVACAFDEHGKLWVVEMRDYPNGPAKGQPPEGRIKVLEDRDGDGRFETATIFADNLLYANGLMHWKGGVIVTAAPHILYLKDTTGDGKADQRTVLYEGFAAENPQLRVSHPTLGPDGWVYVANGLRGGKVVRTGQKEKPPIDIAGRDFRFDLLDDRAEAVSGLGQYGLTFDDWGNRFVCDNRHHLRHVVLPDRALKRNPFLAVKETVEDCSETPPGPLFSGVKIFPLSSNWTTSNLHAGQFTAACGIFVYRGSLLPREHYGTVFTCDPTGNLVHQEVLTPKGATFTARPMRDGVEFLASPDDWFRPVFLTHGPEGAIYLVDMCRAVIEHPEYMPVELKNRPDLLLGKNRGRIWRIVPEKFAGQPTVAGLAAAKTTELVKELSHGEAWRRTTAQRLLLERADPQTADALAQALPSMASPQARLLAAWMLHRAGKLSEDRLAKLLADPHPGVRANAVQIAALRSDPDGKSAPLVPLARDADPQVRFQVALALGGRNGKTLDALAHIAREGADDRWTRAAVATAVPEQAGDLLLALGGTLPRGTGSLALVRELAAIVGSRQNPAELNATLLPLTKPGGLPGGPAQTALLLGLTEGLARRGTRLDAVVQTLPDGSAIAAALERIFEHAGKMAADEQLSGAERQQAIRLLAQAPPAKALPILTALSRDPKHPDLRLGAVQSLAALPSPEVARVLLDAWPTFTLAVRQEALNGLLRTTDRVRALLAAVEAKEIQPREIDAAATKRLLGHGDAEVRKKAAALLQVASADRQKVVAEYRPALMRKGDLQKGAEVFRQNCATCHQIAGIGTRVGPDISDVPRTKTAEQILVDILDPNLAIDANYFNYQVTTKDGKVITGLIVSETASSLTLSRGENQTDTVLRQDIDEIRSTGQSLMPEGLEKNITVEQMADLLAFFKNWRYLDGTVPVGPTGK